ncbi:hypothetical protein SeMB42_g02294 [Synchytrium endobioticum]|nr:hypothetical protein SeMB42_g02294 [Synchytrium endobioticum]
MTKYLTLNAKMSASSSAPASKPENAISDEQYEVANTAAPPNLPFWSSAKNPTCAPQETLTADWTGTFGPQTLSVARIMYADQPAGTVTLACLNGGASTAVTVKPVANISDGYINWDLEKSGTTCTGITVTFTDLKANGASCSVSVSDIDAFPVLGSSGGSGGTTTMGGSGTKSDSGKVAVGSTFALVSTIFGALTLF